MGFPIPVLNTNCLVTSKISLYVRPQNLCILTIYGKLDSDFSEHELTTCSFSTVQPIL